jgi:streptogramin lyase
LAEWTKPQSPAWQNQPSRKLVLLDRFSMNTVMSLPRILFLLSSSFFVAAIAGCGATVPTPISSADGASGGACTPTTTAIAVLSCPVRTPVAGVSFSGKVSAGLQPVSGAAVQLYAAGIDGNGSAPAALLNAPLSTTAAGAFTVPGGYTCPSAQTPVYLLSKGGQPGAGSANQYLWLMTALGPCGAIGAGSNFVLNEVTTAGSVWALASFMSSGGSVGASCSNTLGLDNAFLTANNLVNAGTGASPGAGNPSTLTVYSSKLNTLANALNSCAASSGGASCTALFNAAVTGNTVPGNILDAALNIVHSPGNNVAAIFTLASGSAAFSPALHAAPPDWMLHSTVSGGGMSSPASVSVASSGNIWVSSYFNAVSDFQPGGTTAFPSGIAGNGLNQSYGMALDIQGNVWIANEQTNPNSGSGNVAELNSSGAAMATGLTGGGVNYPVAVAADSNGNMWFANYGDSTVTQLTSAGSPVSAGSGWGAKSLAFPVALAIDSSHNAWVANQAGLLPITKISPDGSQISNFDCDCNGASGIATDQGGNVWVANYYGNSVSEVNTCGTLELDAAKGGGLNHPQGIAVDGAGTVWVGNYLGNSISQISGASSTKPGTFVSPSTGFGTDANLLEPYGVAVDASGDIWVSNFGNNTLTQFIGAAVPIKTPLAGPPQQP